MIFPTRVNGIPCQCEITSFTPYVPMRVYGPGMGDADPPEGGEIVFQLRDRKGYPAQWLEKLLTEKTTQQLEEECLVMIEGEMYENC